MVRHQVLADLAVGQPVGKLEIHWTAVIERQDLCWQQGDTPLDQSVHAFNRLSAARLRRTM
jgi:hypothetical protein